MSEVSLRDAGPRGMITIRGDLGEIGGILAGIAGMAVPAAGRVESAGARAFAWMSPDEALLMLPPDEVAEVLSALDAALAGPHALAIDVSDARAVFRLDGAGWRDVLARLTPADLRAFGPGIFRRTRLAQVAAAFWMPEPDAVDVLCFRSVGAYVRDLLENAVAAPAAGFHKAE